jgi:hypothetical protein
MEHWFNVLTAYIGYLALSFGHWHLVAHVVAEFHDKKLTRMIAQIHRDVLWVTRYLTGAG